MSKNKGGRPRIERNEKTAEQVQKLVGYGLTMDAVASVIGMGRTTMKRLYRPEIDTGESLVNASVAEKLYQRCMSGDTTSLIFWAKTRMGWRETQRVDHTSTDGSMATPQTLTVRFVGRSKDGGH